MRRQPEIRQGCTVEVVLQLQYFLWLVRHNVSYWSLRFNLLFY
jgi:hypothetical protein